MRKTPTTSPPPTRRRRRGFSRGPVLAVLWTDLGFDADERRDVARGLVAVLRGLPAAAVVAPRALKTGPEQRPSLAQSTAPLSYRELDERFVFTDMAGLDREMGEAEAGAQIRPLTAYSTARRIMRGAAVPVAHPRAMIKPRGGSRPGPRPWRARPGRGGQRPRVSAYDASTATAELRRELGEPEEHLIAGSKLYVWRHEGSGNGLNLVRLSGQEIHQGETIMGQVHAIRRLAKQCKLRPLYTVASLYNSAGREYHDRPDLLFLEDSIRQGDVEWVAIRDLDRLIRHDETRAHLYNILRRTRTALYIASYGRAVDLEREKFSLQVLGAATEHELDMIRSRTQSAVLRRYVGQGKGRTGAPRFGFYRDPQSGLWVKDPEQYPVRRWIHMRFHELGPEASLERLAKELVETWGPEWEFSPSYLSRILRDPIDVTGERTTRVGRLRVTTIPVELGDDAVPADVFQANNERLDQHRGPNSRLPIGFYCLNGIPVIHAACADQEVRESGSGRMVQPRLRGRSYGDQEFVPRYKHLPGVPPGCHRYAIDADVIEPAVIREVLRLAGSRTLQEEWRRAPRVEVAPDRPLINREGRQRIEANIRILETRKEALERELVQRTLDGEDVTIEDAKLLIGPIQREIQRLQRRLAVATELPPRPEAAGLVRDPILRSLAHASEDKG